MSKTYTIKPLAWYADADGLLVADPLPCISYYVFESEDGWEAERHHDRDSESLEFHSTAAEAQDECQRHWRMWITQALEEAR